MRGGPGDIFVNIAGDEMTGTLVMQNSVPIWSRNVAGQPRHLVSLDNSDSLNLGDIYHPLYLRNNGYLFERYNGTSYDVWTKRSLPIVCKTADETVNNSATLQTDDELSFPVEANTVWVVHYYLWVTTTDPAFFRTNISVPAGADYYGKGYQSFSSGILVFSPGVDLVTSYLTPKLIFTHALVRVGVNAGTVHLQWAQKTADASDTVVEAGSSMVAIRMG